MHHICVILNNDFFHSLWLWAMSFFIYVTFQIVPQNSADYNIFITNQVMGLKLCKSIHLFVLHSLHTFNSKCVSYSSVSHPTLLVEFTYQFCTFIPHRSIFHCLLCDQISHCLLCDTNSSGSEYPFNSIIFTCFPNACFIVHFLERKYIKQSFFNFPQALSLKRQLIFTLYDLTVLLLGIYPKDTKTG